MEIVFLASSMASRGEHSYRLIEEIGAALRSRDIPHRVFAAKSVEPEIAESIALVPHFTHSLYRCDCIYNSLGRILTDNSFRWLDQLWGGAPALEFLAAQLHKFRQGRRPNGQSNYIPLEYRDWKALNRSYFEDLAALPENVWAPENLVVVTATCQNQIGGLVQFLRGRPWNELPETICHLMFPPTWSPSGRPARLGRKFYGMAFAQAAPLIGKTLFFTTENEVMADLFRAEFGIESRILPVPLHADGYSDDKQDQRVRLGFFGYSKSDKGFHLLPETAALCRDRGMDLEFHVQVQHSRWEHATIEAEEALRTMPNVRLIEGALSSKDYVIEMNKVDVVFLPYDPILFGMRGSGIFTEALAAGRPIIASDGTFAAESVKKDEAQGEIFAPYCAQACANAIARLLPRLSLCKERASAKAAAFARCHNGEAYVDALLSFPRTAPASRHDGTVLKFATKEPRHDTAEQLRTHSRRANS